MKNFLISIFPTRLYLELKWFDFKFNRKQHFLAIQERRKRETTEWSSYKPFDDKKAIFVHVPKCAGISVNKALFGNLAGGHTTLEQYLNIYEPKNILSYFKFTIVRNPWDRVVSAYHFLKQGGLNKWDQEFFQKELAAFDSFEDFVKGWLIHPENINKHHHFQVQCHYILDKRNKVHLDFIGYLENIDEDFEYICNKMKIQATLPNSNNSNRNNYQDYYSDETKSVVAEAYKQDIELLGYDFMNSRFN
jgi:hypothetical protein